jgi:hypothetical protein
LKNKKTHYEWIPKNIGAQFFRGEYIKYKRDVYRDSVFEYYPGQTNAANDVTGMKSGTVTYEQYGRVNAYG